jgi:hypothetical protein
MTAHIHELLETGDVDIVASELRSLVHRASLRYASIVDPERAFTMAHVGTKTESAALRRHPIPVHGRWKLVIEVELDGPIEDEPALVHSLESSAHYFGALFRAIAMEVAAGHRRSLPPPHLSQMPPDDPTER